MTDERCVNTLQEIISQLKAWAQVLEVIRSQGDEIIGLWKHNPEMHVIFTGCGSTYYLSLAAASLFQILTGREARAIPAGELVPIKDFTG